MFPRNIMLSANFEHRSGDVQARTVNLTGGGTIPTITLNAEPIGSLRLPHLNTMDLRVSKRFNLGGGQANRGTNQSLQRLQRQHGDRQDRSVGRQLPEADGYQAGPDPGFQHRV